MYRQPSVASISKQKCDLRNRRSLDAVVPGELLHVSSTRSSAVQPPAAAARPRAAKEPTLVPRRVPGPGS